MGRGWWRLEREKRQHFTVWQTECRGASETFCLSLSDWRAQASNLLTDTRVYFPSCFLWTLRSFLQLCCGQRSSLFHHFWTFLNSDYCRMIMKLNKYIKLSGSIKCSILWHKSSFKRSVLHKKVRIHDLKGYVNVYYHSFLKVKISKLCCLSTCFLNIKNHLKWLESLFTYDMLNQV